MAYNKQLIRFLRDLEQIIMMIVQFTFWLILIFGSIKILPNRYQTIIETNPAYHLVEVYRDSFIYQVCFWEKPKLTPQYWIVTTTIFIIAAIIFRKSQPYFVDVL